jgi:hypothetical protein
MVCGMMLAPLKVYSGESVLQKTCFDTRENGPLRSSKTTRAVAIQTARAVPRPKEAPEKQLPENCETEA